MSRAVSCPTVRVFVCVLGGVFGTLLLVPCLHQVSHSTPGVAGRTGLGGVWSCSPGLLCVRPQNWRTDRLCALRRLWNATRWPQTRVRVVCAREEPDGGNPRLGFLCRLLVRVYSCACVRPRALTVGAVCLCVCVRCQTCVHLPARVVVTSWGQVHSTVMRTLVTSHNTGWTADRSSVTSHRSFVIDQLIDWPPCRGQRLSSKIMMTPLACGKVHGHLVTVTQVTSHKGVWRRCIGVHCTHPCARTRSGSQVAVQWTQQSQCRLTQYSVGCDHTLCFDETTV